MLLFYMYQKLCPPVSYGKEFFVHTNTRRGEITATAGGICINPREGYTNFTTSPPVRAKDGWEGVQVVYALMDYYNTVGSGYYSMHNSQDVAQLIAEVAADIGVGQDKASTPKYSKDNQYMPIKTDLLQQYEMFEKREREKTERVEVPPKATQTLNGYSPNYTIIILYYNSPLL